MLSTPLYLGENSKKEFFNMPNQKKPNSFIKENEKKGMAEKIIDKAIKNFKIKKDSNTEKDK